MDEIRNEAIEYFLELLEEKYGDLTDDCGCYVSTGHGNEWMSILQIAKLAKQADMEA